MKARNFDLRLASTAHVGTSGAASGNSPLLHAIAGTDRTPLEHRSEDKGLPDDVAVDRRTQVNLGQLVVQEIALDEWEIERSQFRANSTLNTAPAKPKVDASAFAWKNEMRIGIPEIDLQHRELLEILGGLHEALEMEATQARLGELLEHYSRTLIKHIADEERLMDEAGIAHSGPHKETHRSLIKKMRSFQQDFLCQKIAPEDLTACLSSWLLYHIEGDDQMIGSAFRRDPFLLSKQN